MFGYKKGNAHITLENNTQEEEKKPARDICRGEEAVHYRGSGHSETDGKCRGVCTRGRKKRRRR